MHFVKPIFPALSVTEMIYKPPGKDSISSFSSILPLLTTDVFDMTTLLSSSYTVIYAVPSARSVPLMFNSPCTGLGYTLRPSDIPDALIPDGSIGGGPYTFSVILLLVS